MATWLKSFKNFKIAHCVCGLKTQDQEAAARHDTIEVVDDISEAFALLHSAKISKINSTTLTGGTTTTITPGQTWANISSF